MTSFTTGISRAPTLLFSQLSLANITQTNIEMLDVSQRLSTLVDVSRPSDDPIRAAMISMLDRRLERSDQTLQNLEFAQGSLDAIDSALADATAMLDEAKSLALSSVNGTVSAEERESAAVVVESMIDSLYHLVNRESLVGHIFGGSAPGRQPVIFDDGGYRFVGERGGLEPQLGIANGTPVTLGANNALGALSNRVEGFADLDPDLTVDTRLADLDGARGEGVSLGTIEFSFNAGATAQVDLSGADTIGDVVDALDAAIRQYEIDNAVTILGPGGVGIAGEAISIDVPAGSLAFADLAQGITGQDLGLVGDPAFVFDAVTTDGLDTSPRVTMTTPIASMAGVAGPLDSILLRNNAKAFTIDLSTATTLGDIKAAIEGPGTGVRVEINADGNGINLVTEIAGSSGQAMSVAEVTGGTDTATALGIRSLSAATKLADFNDGRGVDIVSGSVDPVTGVPDPNLDVDFTITLGDGFEIDINLAPADVEDVASLVAAINAQADAQLATAGRPLTDFTAGLSDGANGIFLDQDPGLGGSVSVAARNRSRAAEQLGLLEGTTTGTGGLLGSDRATVRVDNAFTALIDLAEALRTDDQIGIEFAADRIDEVLELLTETRGVTGGRAQRVEQAVLLEEDQKIADQVLRSRFRDTDFAQASTEFGLLQTQLQAGLSVASQLGRLSLLDFLG